VVVADPTAAGAARARLPPIGAFEPLPEEHHLDEYVEAGLAQLHTYLTGRDTNA